MAAAADWKKELGEAGLPTKAQETLLKMGYITKVSFVKAFKTLDALEPFLKKLLLEDKVAGDVKPEFWEWHPVSGVLRGLWEADAKAAGVQQVVVNPPTTAQAGLLSLVGGPKLEAGQLRDLWKKFATNYPSEWLDEHTRPCRQVLQHVWQQQREKDLRFIPWKHLLSESQWERSKKTFEKKEKSLLGFLAEQAGHMDQVEVVVSPSPFAKLAHLKTVWAYPNKVALSHKIEDTTQAMEHLLLLDLMYMALDLGAWHPHSPLQFPGQVPGHFRPPPFGLGTPPLSSQRPTQTTPSSRSNSGTPYTPGRTPMGRIPNLPLG